MLSLVNKLFTYENRTSISVKVGTYIYTTNILRISLNSYI